VHNNIIEKDRFSTGKKVAIIRVVAPCSLVVKKWAKAPKLKNILPAFDYENPVSYLSRAFNQSFPTINLKRVSSKEIEDIPKSLKIKVTWI